MNVSAVMNALPRYTHRHWLEDLRLGAEAGFQARTLPFDGSPPLPGNIGLARNKPAGAINTQKLALQAACTGAERTAWIFGADAECIGLTLKHMKPEEPCHADDEGGCDPVLVLANIRGRQSNPLEGHYAYFIDQFTDASINRCASYARWDAAGIPEDGTGEGARQLRSRIAGAFLFSLQDYDSGLSRRTIQTRGRGNIRENSRQGTPGFIRAKNAYRLHTANMSPAKKILFNRIRAWRERQETAGEACSVTPAVPRESVYTAFQSLLEHPSAFSKLWFEADAFTRGLISPQFEPEAVSGREEGIRPRKEADHDR
jgi:hypothetical protein